MEKLIRGLSIFVGALLVVAVALNFSNVFGRYLLGKPIFWAEEALGFLQIAFVVVGAALVSRDNAHLRMDAAEHFMPARLKRRLDILSGVITVVVALIVAWMSAEIVTGMIASDHRSMALDLPLAIPYAAFPLGFTLIAFFSLLRVIKLLYGQK